MNIQVPDELRKRIKAIAKARGMTLNDFCTRALAASADAEEQVSPGFLEAFEKFLAEQRETAP